MTTVDVTLDQVLALARRLRPIDQARLIARLAPTMEQALIQPQLSEHLTRPSLRGLLMDLGSAPSETDIIGVQREMWTSFAGEDV